MNTLMIPQRFVRRDMVQREFGPPDNRRRIWCGFLAKDRPSDDVIDVDPLHWTVVWLLRGGGVYQDAVCEQRIGAGDLVIRRPGHRHSTMGDPNGEWVEFFVVIDQSLAHALAETGVMTSDMRVLHPGVDLSLVGRCEALMRDIERAAPDALGDLLARIHGLVAEFLALDRRRRQGDSRSMAIEQARRLLDAEYATAIPEIAHRVGLRYEAFRKAFTVQIGEPPHAYRLRRRIEASRAMLLQGRSSVAEVALWAGFADVFHFNKRFRQIVGEPPARWRRRHLGRE
jgi:AraC-like DNA-binding protein